MNACPFCDYAGPSPILREGDRVIAFEPLNPVVRGHVLIVPKVHVETFADNPEITAEVAAHAAEFAADLGDCNLICSRGAAATQTVRHLHMHIVPRFAGDGLALPWAAGG